MSTDRDRRRAARAPAASSACARAGSPRCATSTTFADATAVATLAPWTRFAADARAARRHRLTSRVAVAFHVAVDAHARREVQPAERRARDLRDERLRRRQADADAVADLRHGQHLGLEAVLHRALDVRAGRLERDLPRVHAQRDRAAAPVGARRDAAAVELDDGQVARARASRRRPSARPRR